MKGPSEAEFLDQVIARAKLAGWICAHFRAARTSRGWETPCQGDAKGFPDLFLLRPKSGHRLAAELKVGANKPTPEQNAWLTAMERCGIPAFIWTPVDWPEIDKVLMEGINE
jgi:hypothetical protein